MINIVWLLLLLSGLVAAGLAGEPGTITKAAMTATQEAVETAMGLAGIMALWLGIMRLAERSGLVDGLTRLLLPAVRRLFPSVPPGHPAMSYIMLNLSANLMGIGGAATPFGLKAMEELQTLNGDGERATPAMCTFVALNTTGFTLVPATIIAFRALAGSANPADIVLPTLVSTAAASASALMLDAHLRRRAWKKEGI